MNTKPLMKASINSYCEYLPPTAPPKAAFRFPMPSETALSSHIILEIAVVAACLAAGGVLKGATGAGAPILAVPALAALFDVRFAVMVMLLPNIATNLWQGYRFRAHLPPGSFMIPLVAGGIVGVIFGTLALKWLPAKALSLAVALAVVGYVIVRVSHPGWQLSMRMGRLLALPAGLCAGILQGAVGLSAPVSLTFLNALKLERPVYIAGISMFFAVFTVFQIVAAVASGIFRASDLYYGVFALVPIFLAMPVGAALAKRFSRAAFDRLILALLVCLSAKLIFDALA